MSFKISIFNYKAGEICEVAGWGAIDDDSDFTSSQFLREAKVKIWDLDECKLNANLE